MDFLQHLKDNFDDVLTENSKNIYKQDNELNNTNLNICKSEITNLGNNNIKKKEEFGYYSREEIYGEYDSDFDNIEEDIYEKLPTEFDENYFIEMETEQNEDDYKDVEYDEQFEKLVELERKKEKENKNKNKNNTLIEIEDDDDNNDDSEEEERVFDDEMQKIINKVNKSGKQKEKQIPNNVLNDPERRTIIIKKHKNKNVKFNEPVIDKIEKIQEIKEEFEELDDLKELEELEELEEIDKNLKYQNNFESVIKDEIKEIKEEIKEDKDDDGVYIINTLNLFMQYYNNKNKKKDNLMSGIKNNEKDTNKQMEEFMYAMNEYEYIKSKIFENKRESFCFKNIDLVSEYIDDEDFEKFYALSIEDENEEEIERVYSPSLLDCLNYLYVKEIKNNWKIINIK